MSPDSPVGGPATGRVDGIIGMSSGSLSRCGSVSSGVSEQIR